MTLSEYDTCIKPLLIRIEVGAEIAAHAARDLLARPAFETLAEHELAIARQRIGDALEMIVQAQAIYKTKKLENT